MSQNLLIASRNEAFLSAMREILEQGGFSCELASSVDEAYAHIHTLGLAVVDMDTLPLRLPLPHVGVGREEGDLRAPFRAGRLAEMLSRLGGQDRMELGEGWYFLRQSRLLVKEKNALSVALTEKEAALLAALMDAAGETVPRQSLLTGVWGYGDDIDTHTLETHLYRLRAKLKEAGLSEDRIATTPDGYRLERNA